MFKLFNTAFRLSHIGGDKVLYVVGFVVAVFLSALIIAINSISVGETTAQPETVPETATTEARYEVFEKGISFKKENEEVSQFVKKAALAYVKEDCKGMVHDSTLDFAMQAIYKDALSEDALVQILEGDKNGARSCFKGVSEELLTAVENMKITSVSDLSSDDVIAISYAVDSIKTKCSIEDSVYEATEGYMATAEVGGNQVHYIVLRVNGELKFDPYIYNAVKTNDYNVFY